MKPIAMKCNPAQYKKIKPILLQNGFKEISITCFKEYPYLINNFSQTEKRLGNGCKAHLSNDRKLFEEWNEDIFLEYCGIKWQLPEKWCIESTPETYQVIKDWLVKNDPDKCNWEFYERNDKRMITSKFTHLHPKAYKNDNSVYTLFDFEQFHTYVVKQKPNTMQTLTLGQLKDLYTVSDCSKWQSKIGSYLGDNLLKKDDFKVEIKSEDIQLLLKQGTLAQQNAVEKLGIVLSNPIEWDKIKTGSKVMLKSTEQVCGGDKHVDFNKPFDVVFFKTPHAIFSDGEFSKKGSYPCYATFYQDGKYVTFGADENTDYIVSVIEY